MRHQYGQGQNTLMGRAPAGGASEFVVRHRLCRRWVKKYAYPGSTPSAPLVKQVPLCGPVEGEELGLLQHGLAGLLLLVRGNKKFDRHPAFRPFTHSCQTPIPPSNYLSVKSGTADNRRIRRLP